VFLFGSIVGSGALWSYLSWVTETQKAEMERLRTSSDVRRQLNERLSESRDLLYLTFDLSTCDKASARYSVDRCGQQTVDRLKLLNSDIIEIEAQLAQIERRPPRDLNLTLPLPPPINLGVSPTRELYLKPSSSVRSLRPCPPITIPAPKK